MGWETYLEIDRALLEISYSHAPSAPTLLFRRSDADLSDNAVVWVTSARAALQNLRAAGFTWELVLEEYTSSRVRAPGHRDHRFHGILITQNGAS